MVYSGCPLKKGFSSIVGRNKLLVATAQTKNEAKVSLRETLASFGLRQRTPQWFIQAVR